MSLDQSGVPPNWILRITQKSQWRRRKAKVRPVPPHCPGLRDWLNEDKIKIRNGAILAGDTEQAEWMLSQHLSDIFYHQMNVLYLERQKKNERPYWCDVSGIQPSPSFIIYAWPVKSHYTQNQMGIHDIHSGGFWLGIIMDNIYL